MICGLPVLTEVEDVCAGCASGKHHRKKFDKEQTWKASYPLELIHTDLCGPMQNESVGGTDTSSHSLTTTQECAGYTSSETNLMH